MPSGAKPKPVAPLTFQLRTPHNLALRITTHVGVTGRDPDPTSRRYRDHVRSAFNVAAINAEDAFAPIRIRASFISTKIAPASGSLADAGFAIGD